MSPAPVERPSSLNSSLALSHRNYIAIVDRIVAGSGPLARNPPESSGLTTAFVCTFLSLGLITPCFPRDRALVLHGSLELRVPAHTERWFGRAYLVRSGLSSSVGLNAVPLRSVQFTSAKLGWIRQIAARVGRSGRLGCCRPHSAVVDHTRLLPAPLGHTRLSPAPLGHTRLLSAPLGHTRLLPAPLGHTRLSPAPLGHTRLLSAPLGHTRLSPAPLGHTRLLPAPLGHTRLSPALPDSAPRCNCGRWHGPAPRPEPREGTERWDSRLSPAHPVPARPRVPRSAPCSAERGLWARSGDNALGSAAAPGGSGRCPQGRKNHPTPATFARSFGVGAAKGKRLQQQGSALEGSGPAHAVGKGMHSFVFSTPPVAPTWESFPSLLHFQLDPWKTLNSIPLIFRSSWPPPALRSQPAGTQPGNTKEHGWQPAGDTEAPGPEKQPWPQQPAWFGAGNTHLQATPPGTLQKSFGHGAR
ncbi:uncharacterized protein [Agelaius tricolor]|uniref:uncharacterized protein n=1 Tax=Agelaius tricolor TaxID=9191 RepID=UPI0039F1A6EC